LCSGKRPEQETDSGEAAAIGFGTTFDEGACLQRMRDPHAPFVLSKGAGFRLRRVWALNNVRAGFTSCEQSSPVGSGLLVDLRAKKFALKEPAL